MAFTHSPKIVQDGLIVYFDIANSRSYISGSIPAITNSLVGSITGSLYNDVSGSIAENPSSWIFDGVDDSIDTIIPTQPVYHLSIWFTRTSGINTSYTSGDRYLLGWGGSGNLTGIAFGDFTGAADDETILLYQDSQGLDNFTYIKDTGDSNFHNLTINWNGSQYDMYLDGTSRTTYTGSIGHLAQFDINHIYLGRSNNSEYHHTGKISSIQLYNKSLSTQEIQQNYNALKNRFK
jgi:hypothetical protein